LLARSGALHRRQDHRGQAKNPISSRFAFPLLGFVNGVTEEFRVKVLGQHPQIGRPVEETDVDVDDPEGHTYRELPIGFGDSGYVVLYRHDGERVTVLALRHQKEVSF